MKKAKDENAKVPWGGVGGSGKHSNDAKPELDSSSKTPASKEIPWGGIGGSGKHSADIAPESKD